MKFSLYFRETQPAYYPFETIITAIILGFIPYKIFRGPFNRIFRKKNSTNEGK